MSAMNRKMFANRDARNKLAGMGGILASSPELMGATQRFQDGGMTTPRGVPDSPRLSESMNVPIATLGGKSFFLSADNRSIVDGDGSVVRDPSVLRAIMQQTAPAPAPAPQSEEFVPPSMGASELNTPGIMQALNNAPQIQDERSALMAEAQSLIEANRTPESDALRARVDETVDPRGNAPQGIMEMVSALAGATDDEKTALLGLGADGLPIDPVFPFKKRAPQSPENASFADLQRRISEEDMAMARPVPQPMDGIVLESPEQGLASDLLRSAQEAPVNTAEAEAEAVFTPRFRGDVPENLLIEPGVTTAPMPNTAEAEAMIAEGLTSPEVPAAAPNAPRVDVKALDAEIKKDPGNAGPITSNTLLKTAGVDTSGMDIKQRTVAMRNMLNELMGTTDADEKEEFWMNMAMVGFGIASGESSSAMKNIADGLLSGTAQITKGNAAKKKRNDDVTISALELAQAEISAEGAQRSAAQTRDSALQRAYIGAGLLPQYDDAGGIIGYQALPSRSGNNTPERLRQQILKQVDDIETAELFGVMSEDGVTIDPVKLDAFIKQQQRIGLRLDPPDTGGEGTTVGQTTEYAQGTYRKISEGPDSDPTTWEKV